jgi:hypothetical protein
MFDPVLLFVNLHSLHIYGDGTESGAGFRTETNRRLDMINSQSSTALTRKTIRSIHSKLSYRLRMLDVCVCIYVLYNYVIERASESERERERECDR